MLFFLLNFHKSPNLGTINITWTEGENEAQRLQVNCSVSVVYCFQRYWQQSLLLSRCDCHFSCQEVELISLLHLCLSVTCFDLQENARKWDGAASDAGLKGPMQVEWRHACWALAEFPTPTNITESLDYVAIEDQDFYNIYEYMFVHSRSQNLTQEAQFGAVHLNSSLLTFIKKMLKKKTLQINIWTKATKIFDD
jgi:hypothetical protein